MSVTADEFQNVSEVVIFHLIELEQNTISFLTKQRDTNRSIFMGENRERDRIYNELIDLHDHRCRVLEDIKQSMINEAG